MNTRVRVLQQHQHNWLLRTNKEDFKSKQVVIATSFRHASKLLSGLSAANNLIKQIEQFDTEPIVTIYMQFSPQYQLDDYMLGLSDGLCQWFIDRRSCGQAGMIAAVISANGPHNSLDKQSLIKQVIKEFSQLYPDWPEPQSCYLVREQQATFRCDVDVTNNRPNHFKISDSLWLTGDYIDNGLPATLESAVQNGVQCANEIIQQ